MADYTLSYTGAQVDSKLAEIANLAPLDSPALTGTPTAPTAAAGTDTTQVATTAFVTAAISSALGDIETALAALL